MRGLNRCSNTDRLKRRHAHGARGDQSVCVCRVHWRRTPSSAPGVGRVTMANIKGASRIERVKEYFRKSDEGEFAADLFAEGFQFYWPKFGVGHGKATFFEMAGGLRSFRVRRAS